MACAKKKTSAFRKRIFRGGMLSVDGEKPVDLITYYTKQTDKQRQMMFEKITALSRINCKGFLENRARNRVPVPIHEKKRVLLAVPFTNFRSTTRRGKARNAALTPRSFRRVVLRYLLGSFEMAAVPQALLANPSAGPTRACSYVPSLGLGIYPKGKDEVKEGDSEYFPATYATCERDDYILSQAPTKENYRDFWRMVWRDGCKILVSLSEKFSDVDSELCFPYWPKKEGEKMDIDGKRFVIQCQKKTDFKGYVIYDLGLASTDPSMDTAVVGKKSSFRDTAAGADEAAARPVTLMHYENWAPNTWPDLDLLGPFVQSLSKREIQVMRKSLDNYIPPVVIQSYDGLGRAAIIWVSTILMKDIEKKECFDVEDLAKKCARARPGALHKKIDFCVLIALAFRLSSLGGWTPLSDARAKIKEIEGSYNASMKK